MVDPNPGRGMPLPLQRYWLTGKGAAKIRWNVPGDFLRCVRQLRKYFPQDPKGLCNILHVKATGGPPGHGSAEHGHAITAASVVLPINRPSMGVTADRKAMDQAGALLAAMPMLGEHLWAGPLAPIGKLTMEPRKKRVFEHGALEHRVLPLPLDWRKFTGQGHEGSMTVARILGITYGPNEAGIDHAWGWGDYLSEEIIPEARAARYMMEQGVVGTSVDPGGEIRATVDPLTGIEHNLKYVIGGATLVSIPAFSPMRLYSLNVDGDWPDDDMDMVMDLEGDEASGDCGCGGPHTMGVGPSSETFAVNSRGWQGLPLAPRNSIFDNDDAVKRIQAWAGADVDKLRRAFLWYDPRLPATNTTSYRLPVGDVINGRLTLIFHAIYAAAALLSGAHGGLPDVPEADKHEIRNVISAIYPEMATAFADPSIRAPWDRSAQEGIQLAMSEFATDSAKEPYGDVAYADPGYQEDGKKRYPLDSEEHCRAAWSYINQADNASKYTAAQLKLIKGRIKAALKKYGVTVADDSEKMSYNADYTMTAEGYPIAPPATWFNDPKLGKKTPLTVTREGQVYGHLAAWGECHRDVTMRECVLAPRSQQQYAPFHLGEVMTAEGETVKAGKIVMDTRHADIRLGYSAAALHYDNTGDEIAVIRAGEDEYGIWVAGAVVPEATPRKVAKLRRSPLSGDWRRERGSLELTAALAVNTPAFPVYAMENEERLALVAAGTVIPDLDDLDALEDHLVQVGTDALNTFSAPPTGIDALVASLVEDEVSRQEEEIKQERAQRLADLLEDEGILAQRERAKRFSGIMR